jgi:hypothetical protein
LQDFAAELLAVNPNDFGVENAAAQGKIAVCTAAEPVAAVTFWPRSRKRRRIVACKVSETLHYFAVKPDASREKRRPQGE